MKKLFLLFIYFIFNHLYAQEKIDLFTFNLHLKVEAESYIQQEALTYLNAELDSLGKCRITNLDSCQRALQILVNRFFDETQQVNYYFIVVLSFEKYSRWGITLKYFEKDFIKDNEVQPWYFLAENELFDSERYKILNKYINEKLPVLFYNPDLKTRIIREEELKSTCKMIIQEFDQKYLARARKAHEDLRKFFKETEKDLNPRK